MSTQDPSMMPLGIPPPGVVPNFEHPASKQRTQIVAFSVILVITTVILYLRMHAKLFVRRAVDSSDWTCIIGYAFTIGYSYTLYALSVIPGTGMHNYELRVKDLLPSYYGNLIASGVLLAASLLFIKLSLILLIAKIFWVRPWARYLSYAVISSHMLAYVIYLILALYYCVPRPGETAMGILIGVETARCTNIVTLSSFLAVLSAVEDFLMLSISIPILMNLQTALKRRLKASSVFLLGLTATGLSIAGAYFRLTASSDTDSNWGYTTLFIVAYYEICLGIICACLPCLPLLGKSDMAQRLLNSRIFSRLSSVLTRRSRSSTREHRLPSRDNNSSTSNLKNPDGVIVTRSFDVENHSYELQEEGLSGHHRTQIHGA